MNTLYEIKDRNEDGTDNGSFTIAVYKVEDGVVRAAKTDKKGNPTTNFINYTAKEFQTGIRLGTVVRL